MGRPGGMKQRALALMLCAGMTVTMAPVMPSVTAQAADPAPGHLAAYVGEIPEAEGVTWADSVTADLFDTAYETVTAQSADGTEYKVEVVPKDLVYFIDSYSDAPSAENDTPPYLAVKALAGDTLKNQNADQLYKEGETQWGLSADSVKTKADMDPADKQGTGIYHGNNAQGKTLSYKLTLEAGTYTFTSGHQEWWNMTRPMEISLTHDGETETLADITVSRDNLTEIVSSDVTIEEDQTVTYSVTSTGNQAPVISWLGVAETEEKDPDEPSGPALSGEALEDSGKVSVRSGASFTADYGDGQMVSVTSGWIAGGNSAVDGGAAIDSADSYFKTPQFTLYADILLTGDPQEKAGIVMIGTEGANFKIVQKTADEPAKIVTGSGEYPLNVKFEKRVWYGLGLVYSEDADQGYVTVYRDGEKISDTIALGFKLSGQSGIVAGFGISYATGFMHMGYYDNISVAASADEEAAAEETAARADALKDRDPDSAMLVIDGADVEKAAQNRNGLTWKGWGLLSGNGTSNLLLDYKAENPDAYQEMLEYLFGGEHPIFTHIKMEMGNDGNNSTAAEACTMRYEDEEADASRDPGFQIAADAKKINPDVKVSFLRWEMPNWVRDYWNSDRTGKGYEAVYKWYRETIFDAYEKYGYVVDFVDPDKNETSDPDEGFIKWIAAKFENETDFPDYFDQDAIDAYHNIRIIASDENKSLNIVPSMRNDKDLYDAVDIIGFHYRTDATADYVKMADEDDKEVWYSEGCATFGYSEFHENKTTQYGQQSIGGYQSPLAMAEGFMVSFVSSRRTHYIFQPAIGGFYEGIQYAHKELLSARDPWSGYIHYDPALQIIAQFSRFAETGWENEDNTAGIWRMIPQASAGGFAGSSSEHNTSGIDGNASYITIASPDKKDFSVVLLNNTQNEKKYSIRARDLDLTADSLNLWETATDSYMKYKGSVELKDGVWEITLAPYSVLTATTLDDYTDGTEENTTPDELAIPEEGVNTDERAVLDTDETGKNADTSDEYLYADDFEYAYDAEDYLESRGGEPRYMIDTHGAWIVEDGRLAQILTASVNQWNGGDPMTIVGDFRWMNYIADLDITVPADNDSAWAGLGIRTQTGMNWNQDGYTLRIYGSGKWELYRAGAVVNSGSVKKAADGAYHVSLAAQNSQITAFVNGTTVCSYTDNSPMDAGRIKLSSSWTKTYFDNLEVRTIAGTIPYATSMTDGSDDSVQYDGNWMVSSASESGNSQAGSADRWYRTNSINTAANAAFTFEFPVEGTGFSIIGNNGSASVLDVYVDDMETPYASDVSTMASANRYASYSLSGLDNAKHTVKVVVKSGTLNIDALYTLGTQLEGDDSLLVSVQDDNLPEMLAMTADGKAEGLPEKVTVLTAGGETKEMEVTWDDSAVKDTEPFAQTSVTGTVKGGETVLGTELTVSVPVIVMPADLVYFANMSADPVSSDYTLIMDAAADTLRHTAENHDQAYSEELGFGYVGSAGQLRTTNADMFQSMRYMGGGETLTYQFDLEPGEYNVYVGMFDPSGWYGSHNGTRYADIAVNDNVVQERYQYLNNVNDTLAYEKITVGEDGKLTVAVSPSVGTNQAIQVSFIAVAGQASEEPSEPVSKTLLERWLNEAKGYVEDGTVSGLVESVQKLFADAIAKGEAVMADENATRDEVIDAAADLMFAIHALGMKAADKTDLEMALELAGMIDLDKYVEAGQAEFLSAKDAAEAVMADGDAMQEETNAAWDALVEAMGALRLKADKSVLQDLVDQVSDTDLSGYTEESASVFRAALASANAILADVSLSEDDQAEVDEAKEALREAYDGLVKTGGEDPENPGTEDPDDPSAEDPQDPVAGDGQSQGSAQDGKPSGNAQGSGSSGADRAAKTGDTAGAVPAAAGMMAVSLLGIAAVLAAKKRRG